MERSRQLNKSMYSHRRLLLCQAMTRFCYTGLIAYASDYGWMEADWSGLHYNIFGRSDVQSDDISRMVRELATVGLITFWKDIRTGELCLHHPNWFKHQYIQRRHPCKLQDAYEAGFLEDVTAGMTVESVPSCPRVRFDITFYCDETDKIYIMGWGLEARGAHREDIEKTSRQNKAEMLKSGRIRAASNWGNLNGKGAAAAATATTVAKPAKGYPQKAESVHKPMETVDNPTEPVDNFPQPSVDKVIHSSTTKSPKELKKPKSEQLNQDSEKVVHNASNCRQLSTNADNCQQNANLKGQVKDKKRTTTGFRSKPTSKKEMINYVHPTTSSSSPPPGSSTTPPTNGKTALPAQPELPTQPHQQETQLQQEQQPECPGESEIGLANQIKTRTGTEPDINQVTALIEKFTLPTVLKQVEHLPEKTENPMGWLWEACKNEYKHGAKKKKRQTERKPAVKKTVIPLCDICKDHGYIETEDPDSELPSKEFCSCVIEPAEKNDLLILGEQNEYYFLKCKKCGASSTVSSRNMAPRVCMERVICPTCHLRAEEAKAKKELEK